MIDEAVVMDKLRHEIVRGIVYEAWRTTDKSHNPAIEQWQIYVTTGAIKAYEELLDIKYDSKYYHYFEQELIEAGIIKSWPGSAVWHLAEEGFLDMDYREVLNMAFERVGLSKEEIPS